MPTKALVAYASKYGATEEIAERIGLKLSQSGLQVDILRVEEVQKIEPYEAIVIGSAIYLGHWRKVAVKFLRKYRRQLANKKVWLFSSGPTGKGKSIESMKGRKVAPTLQILLNIVKPNDIALFRGYLNPDKMNLIERFLVGKLKTPVGDFRDWEAIENWAQLIVDDLHVDAIE